MYNVWLSQDDAEYVYTAVVLATYREKAEFLERLEGLPWALERI